MHTPGSPDLALPIFLAFSPACLGRTSCVQLSLISEAFQKAVTPIANSLPLLFSQPLLPQTHTASPVSAPVLCLRPNTVGRGGSYGSRPAPFTCIPPSRHSPSDPPAPRHSPCGPVPRGSCLPFSAPFLPAQPGPTLMGFHPCRPPLCLGCLSSPPPARTLSANPTTAILQHLLQGPSFAPTPVQPGPLDSCNTQDRSLAKLSAEHVNLL